MGLRLSSDPIAPGAPQLGGMRPWSPADIPNLVSWVDLLSASRYTLSGSDVTSLLGRAGTYASTAFVADPETATPAADGSSVPTIGDSGTDLLAGKPCLVIGTNTTAVAPGIPARGTGAWTVIVLTEIIAYVANGVYGMLAGFGDRYVASPSTPYWSGGIGQASADGAAWGGGVSSPGVVLTTPTSSVSAISKVRPSVWAARRAAAGATTLWHDGVQDGSATVAHDLASTGLIIARAGGYASPQARIWAALWYDRALTDDEIAEVTSYLLRSYRVGYIHVVGDSIAAGTGTLDPTTDAWPAIFQSDLRATHGFGARLNRQAVSGHDTADVLDGLAADVVARKSGLFAHRERCLIAVGSNDFAVSAPEVEGALAAAKTNMTAIVTALLAEGIAPEIVEVLDRGDYVEEAQTAAIGTTYLGQPSFNAWLRSGAAGTTKVHTVQSTLQAGGWGTGALTFDDLVHPDNAGAILIGEFIAAQSAPRW